MIKFLNQGPLKTLSQFQPLSESFAASPKRGEDLSVPVVKQLLTVQGTATNFTTTSSARFRITPRWKSSSELRNANRASAHDRRGGDHQRRLETDNHLNALGWAIVRLDVFRIGGSPCRQASY